MRDHMAARIQAAVGRNDFSATVGEGPLPNPGSNSREAYTRAMDVCQDYYTRHELRPGVFGDAVAYLQAAEKRGEPVPDYIFATPDGGLWLEWCDGERKVVEFNCYAKAVARIAASFGLFILAMAAVWILVSLGRSN